MQEEIDQFIAQNRQHYATGFPNPERIGCPPPGQLTAQIWRGQLPALPLRQHLLACSECFQEYRTQLAAYQAARPATLNWWQQWRHGWRVRAALALSFVLLVSLSGWFVWQQLRTPLPTQIAMRAQVATPVNPPLPEPPPSATAPTHKQTTSSALPTPRGVVTHTQAIDLNEYVALRDVKAGYSKEKIIRLPAQHLRLQLTLPEGSAKGTYILRLIDAFGRSVRQSTARSQTGKTLTTPLDLRRVSAHKYRLEIFHGTEAPDFYSLVVTRKKGK